MKSFFFCCIVLSLFIAEASYTQSRYPLPAEDLGVPVTSANRISYKTAYNFGPARLNLLCWTTTAESGGSFCAMDLANGRVYSHPLNSLEAYPIVYGSDGRVYVGSTTGEVMRWDPGTDAWGPLGKPLFRQQGVTVNHVRVLCEGRDGWLYAGSCYGERARINIQSGMQEKIPETPEKGNWYVSAATMLPDGKIAFGYGHKARVFVYDPVAKRDTGQLLPPGWTEDGFCFNLVAGESVLYATHFPSGRRACFDVTTLKFLGQLPWPNDTTIQSWSKWVHSSGYGSAVDFYLVPGTNQVVSFDGVNVQTFDPYRTPQASVVGPAGFHPDSALALALRYEVTSDCRVLQYDALRMNVVKELSPDQPRVERSIFGLGAGPDGKIYGGAYQSTLLFVVDPSARKTWILGDHHPGWSGETYSFAVRGNELVCASYTNGAVVAYDPSKDWECRRGAMRNPRILGFFGQQVYRPYSTCVSSDGTIWCVGPAGWGSTGGGIGSISPSSGRVKTSAFPDVPLKILPLRENRLIVCSDSLVRWWDGAANTGIAVKPLPVRCVDACLAAGESSSTVILAGKSEFLLADVSTPGTLRIIRRYSSPVPCDRVLPRQGGLIICGGNGLAQFDLARGSAIHFCNTPPGSRWAIALTGDAVYFSVGSHLMKAVLPQGNH